MRLLAICPRIRKEESRIVATTAWRARLLLLGLLYRKVVIDPVKRRLCISSRSLWLIRRERRIPFSKIEAVTYGYEDWSPDQILAFAHDSFDCFSVGLRLMDQSQIHLFHFLGEGTFGNDGPLPDWMYWEEFAWDVSGSQEKESRGFVELLSRMIGVSVVPPQ
jgi:hypothetical protein